MKLNTKLFNLRVGRRAAADTRNLITALPTLSNAERARLPIQQVLQRQASEREGLIEADANDRLTQDGPNEVVHDAPPHALIQLLQAFRNPFVLVLLGLAFISYLMDVQFAAPGEHDWKSVIIMMAMVTISGLLRFFQEYRSNKAAATLKSMVSNTATVWRRAAPEHAPERREIAMRALVVGDIVNLQAGDMIPADLRLIASRDLFVSQAALTGEALPVEKSEQGDISGDALDQPNICFMGTNVVSGTATAVVLATGGRTYFGSVAKNVVTTKRIETSFDRGVHSVSMLLIKFMLVMVVVVFLINGFTKGDWLTALTFALAVAVGLTPEMLPMIVSTNLAKGAIAMARRKVVVKRLNAVQNFGAMDVLCTDKTGTLTQDKIILDQHLDIHGHGHDDILTLAWLNSKNQSGQKNLMDIAIVRHADARGARLQPKGYTKIDELPFDFVRRRLSVVVARPDGTQMMISKGAVEEMLAVSSHYMDGGVERALDDTSRAELIARAQTYNHDGFRVLLIATRTIAADLARTQYKTEDERDLTIHGFLTFLDPPKESAAPAIRALREHGVAVKVLTGDNAIVTARVCREVGLDVQLDAVLEGYQIEAMDDLQLASAVTDTIVFAKLTPLQKSRIVRALQANGHTVGFLGDGINDAPALRDADVGISVDTGADIAKETADIILLDKSLMVLEQGVIKGRETFGNILKYLNMTASSNFGNVFSVLVASAWLPWEPMLALHLLIQNLVYDISQMALPWDKMDEEFLKKPRKWDAPNIGRFMVWMGPTSSVFDITTYILMWTVFGAGAAYHLHGGDAGQLTMNSGWFIEGLVSQTLVVHMLRTRKIPFIQSTASFPVLVSTIVAIAIACWLPFSQFAQYIGFIPLDGTYFYWLLATMLGYMVLTQCVKTVYIRRFGQWY